MAFTTVLTCPACRACHLVSCLTEGAPQRRDEENLHCFECNYCRTKLDGYLPANAARDTIRVRSG